ncbi:MAG: hypothetical protein IPK59_03910 [Rhodospirillaceae bacterium]|nr:hypothetical protein [Rhodospirillaceae bacterium]
MARHAADVMVQITARVPRGNQGFWEIIRDLHRKKKRWTVLDVDGHSNVALGTVNDFVQRLLKGGYIVRDGAFGKSAAFRLVKDQPDAPYLRRDGTAARELGLCQDQMWRAMKMLARFDARDLALYASTEDVPVKQLTAKSYIARLYRAGYLIMVTEGKPGHRPGTGTLATYRLLPAMNTGPLAPQIQQTDWVWDPNKRLVMGPEAVASQKGGRS